MPTNHGTRIYENSLPCGESITVTIIFECQQNVTFIIDRLFVFLYKGSRIYFEITLIKN